VAVYGEVNSLLRYHVDALKDEWNPTILHLVRDGREVVRSIMNRVAFTSADRRHTGRLRPRRDDPIRGEWDRLDRFARVCWYWGGTNEFLLERNLAVVRLEDIVASYEKFSENLLGPLDLSIGQQDWAGRVSHPVNPSVRSTFPGWSEWTQAQRDVFSRLCGSTMSRLGY
jgi:hypothetical protein